MRKINLKHIFLFFLTVCVLFVFMKPFHSHASASSKTTQETDKVDYRKEAHSHANHSATECSTTKDCGGDCACPLHRINGCNALTALTKTVRFVVLKLASSSEVEALFSAKQSPILDGPFQPPRA